MRQTGDRRGANTSRGQAGPLSYALVFAMILTGATVVLATGGIALSDAQDSAEAQRAEHTMTLFDSRAAMVALGESGSQSVSFGQDSGIFETRPTDGYLMIKHTNYDGAGADIELYKEALGAVVYENGERELAYQGGGIWRKDAQGDAQVISPPEFHYRGATLTLPVVRVDGHASGSGSVTARITGATRAEIVYPDASETYPGPSRQYLNPIREGEVSVYVKSDYYRGWATYFRERTEGEVTVFDSNQTVKVKLKSIGGAPGEFDMPDEGSSLPVEGFGGPLNEFEITLTATKTGNGNGKGRQFTESHWSFFSDQGGDQFEIHIKTDGSTKCTSDDPSGDLDGDVGLSVYYYNSSTDTSHEWVNSGIDPNDPDTAIDADCENKQLAIDFMSENTNLTYEDIDDVENVPGGSNKWEFGDNINSREAPATLTDHPEGFAKGEEDSVKDVLNYYMSRMGINYDLTVTDGPGNNNNNNNGKGSGRIDEGESYGTLLYDEDASGQYITYLHVTDNEITVTIDS